MTRYPHLPPALLTLLESGPLTRNDFKLKPSTYVWQGTPTELYSALEPHRVEPWPANPVSLSLWLKHHAREHGIQVDFHHTGERRVLRLARGSNGLGGEGISQHSETKSGHNETKSAHTGSFWSFPTWAALLEALPALLEVGESYCTLAFEYRRQPGADGPSLDLGVSRISRTVPASWLPLVLREWAAQYPQPREVRVYPGEVEVSTVWPLG